MIKEGYRHYDSPVAMPDLGYAPTSHPISLEEYFHKLDKQFGLPEKEEEVKDTGKSVTNQQVGGTHYQRGIQPWDIIIEWELDYFEGNVLKYLLRWKFKDGVQDLKKARHYLDKLIERNTNDNKENN